MEKGGSFGRRPNQSGSPQQHEAHNRVRMGNISGAGSGEQPIRGPHESGPEGAAPGGPVNRDHLPKITAKDTVRSHLRAVRKGLRAAREEYGQALGEAHAELQESGATSTRDQGLSVEATDSGRSEWPHTPAARTPNVEDVVPAETVSATDGETGAAPHVQDVTGDRDNRPMPTTFDTLRFYGRTLLGGLQGIRAGLRQGMADAHERYRARIQARNTTASEVQHQEMPTELADSGRSEWPHTPAARTPNVEDVVPAETVSATDDETGAAPHVQDVTGDRDNRPMPTTLDTLRFYGRTLLGGLQGIRAGLRQGMADAHERYSVRVQERATASDARHVELPVDAISSGTTNESSVTWPNIPSNPSLAGVSSADALSAIEEVSLSGNELDDPGQRTMTLRLQGTPNYLDPVDKEYREYGGKRIKGFVSIHGSDDVWVLSAEGINDSWAVLTKIDQATGKLDTKSKKVAFVGGKTQEVPFQTKEGIIEVKAEIADDGLLHLVAPEHERIHAHVSPGTRVDHPEPVAA